MLSFVPPELHSLLSLLDGRVGGHSVEHSWEAANTATFERYHLQFSQGHISIISKDELLCHTKLNIAEGGWRPVAVAGLE